MEMGRCQLHKISRMLRVSFKSLLKVWIFYATARDRRTKNKIFNWKAYEKPFLFFNSFFSTSPFYGQPELVVSRPAVESFLISIPFRTTQSIPILRPSSSSVNPYHFTNCKDNQYQYSLSMKMKMKLNTKMSSWVWKKYIFRSIWVITLTSYFLYLGYM